MRPRKRRHCAFLPTNLHILLKLLHMRGERVNFAEYGDISKKSGCFPGHIAVHGDMPHFRGCRTVFMYRQ